MGRVNFHGRDSYWAGQNLAMGGWEGKHSRLQRYLDQRLRDGQAWEGSENSFAGVWPETRNGEEMSRSWNSSWESGFKLSYSPILCSVLLFPSFPSLSLASFLPNQNPLHLTLTLHPPIQPKQCKWSGCGIIIKHLLLWRRKSEINCPPQEGTAHCHTQNSGWGYEHLCSTWEICRLTERPSCLADRICQRPDPEKTQETSVERGGIRKWLRNVHFGSDSHSAISSIMGIMD